MRKIFVQQKLHIQIQNQPHTTLVHPLYITHEVEAEEIGKDGNIYKLNALWDIVALQSLLTSPAVDKLIEYTNECQLIRGAAGIVKHVPLVEIQVK